MSKSKEVGALITLALILGIGLIYPVTLLLGNEEIANPELSFKFFLFSILLIGGSFITITLYFTRKIWGKDDKYGNGFGFFNIGEKPALPFFKRFKPFQLFLILSILFSVVFLGATGLKNQGVINSNSFTSTIVLPQQFSNTDILLFSNILIPFAEEMLSLAVMGLLVLFLTLWAVKSKMSPGEYKIYYFVGVPILTGILAVFWHLSAYGFNEHTWPVIFMFWAVKNLIILATGFVFAGIQIHFNNNFWIDFPQLFSNDTAFYTAIVLIIAQIALYIWLYRKRLFGGKKEVGVLG